MADLELIDRMDRFESRLFGIEKRLGMHDPETDPGEDTAHDLQSNVAELFSDPEPETDLVLSYPSRQRASPIPQSDLEQTIGLKWAGWIGAVVLVIGAGLGIKFGYDHGWFAMIPPVARLIGFALAGLGLIGAGEIVYRRVNPLSAAGLFGAGVAVLFVVSYSGHAIYDLYPRDAALILMGISTVIGAAVAHRGKLVSIAVLSLVGGNLAPLLLVHGQPEWTGFLFYLLMLQSVALTLAALGGDPKWWTLRGLSLVTTAMWIASIIDQGEVSTLVSFIILFAALFQLEILISACGPHLKPQRAGATFSLLVTAGMTIAVLYLLRGSPQISQLLFVLGCAGFAAVNSVICWRFSKRSPAMTELSIGYLIQSLALIVVAVPVAFSGVWIAGAWGVLAIAFAAVGYFLETPAARYAAPAVWSLALGALFVWAFGTNGSSHHDHELGFAIVGVDFFKHTLMAFVLALMGQVIAAIVATGRKKPVSVEARTVAKVISMTSSGIWLLACVNGLPAFPATVFVITYAALLALLDFVEHDLDLLEQSAALIAIGTVKWAIFDFFANQPPSSPAPPTLDHTAISAGLVAICQMMAKCLAVRRRGSATVATAREAAVGMSFMASAVWLIVCLNGLSSMTATLAILGYAGLLLAADFVDEDLQLYYQSAGLIAFAAVKWTIFDLLLRRFTGAASTESILLGMRNLTGLALLVDLAILRLQAAFRLETHEHSRQIHAAATAAVVGVFFWMSTFGIDQAFINLRLSPAPFFADPDRAEQVALSIYWSTFALASVAAGFGWRTAGLRYFGLVLFAVTLLKVVSIDLSQVSTGYRIMSFVGLGSLLLGTSVLYGKLSPILLAKELDRSGSRPA